MNTAAKSAVSFWRRVTLGWLCASVLIALTCLPDILRQHYPDPDDTMRRLQVRDLLGGQSWWDVSQHRLASGMMHWSRLVDLPIAAVVLPLRPWFGELTAERVAMVAVPLVTFGLVLALAAHLTRRLLGEEHAALALVIVSLSVPLMFQLRPMRIDHHGWQVVLALAALDAFARSRGDIRSGVAGGTMLAILLTISLEGLPIAAALLGLVALTWALDPARRGQLVGATGATFVGAALLQAATRGPAFFTPACDAVSPVWLAVLATAALATWLATLAGSARLPIRLGLLALGGAACAGVLVLVDARCVAGPFGALDPLVRNLWYDKVLEGLPIWDQRPVWALMSLWLPLVGLLGTGFALRESADDHRFAWWFILAAQIATLLVSVQVTRAAATANAFAVPGATLVLLALLRRARRVPRALPRTIATAGALLSATPGLAALPFLLASQSRTTALDARHVAGLGRMPCTSAEDPRALAALPAARLFAPLDIAPEIIAATAHQAIASGHHRNAAAMHDVIAAFVGTPEQARRIVERYGADYIVGCPGAQETSLYRKAAPNGFWARLERGESFGWLQPVTLPGSPVLVWRVVRGA